MLITANTDNIAPLLFPFASIHHIHNIYILGRKYIICTMNFLIRNNFQLIQP